MTLSNPMTKEDIYPMLVDMLHEMFELDRSKITLDANLYSDLDIDSIDAVDLAVRLKELRERGCSRRFSKVSAPFKMSLTL